MKRAISVWIEEDVFKKLENLKWKLRKAKAVLLKEAIEDYMKKHESVLDVFDERS